MKEPFHHRSSRRPSFVRVFFGIIEKAGGLIARYAHRLERRFVLPGAQAIRRAFKLFSTTERVIFIVLAAVMAVSATVLMARVDSAFLVEEPVHGGALSEGIIGTPRFVNPVLAASDADKDLASLVFAGLFKNDSDGGVSPVLAASYEISDDQKTYTVHLKPGLMFHDNTPLTADDVLFTIAKVNDPALKSPLAATWSGVSAEKIDDRTVAFHLKQPYAPFLENLTLGILPRHIWEKIPDDEFPWSELNLSGVGAGPYSVVSVSRNASGIPSEIDLESFPHYALGEAHIADITAHFYANEDKAVSALMGGDIDSLGGISPERAADLGRRGYTIDTALLPRVFGIFFNQNQQKVFADKSVRQALSLAAPRERIIAESLSGFAVPIDSPVASETAMDSYDARVAQAANILDKAGWKYSTTTGVRTKTTGKGKTATSASLSFTLATANTPDLASAAKIIADEYAKLGVAVTVNVYDPGDLEQNVIRERKYDALLFGEVVGRDDDLFPFWHSSQRFDPGLNIALYANSKADKLLDSLRKESDTLQRQTILTSLLAELEADVPAAFLYAPKYIYVLPATVRNVSLGIVSDGSDRFASVNEWFAETARVWKIFVKDSQ